MSDRPSSVWHVTVPTQGDAVLEPRLVGDIEGHFFIPAYQRGYRWGAPEVHRMLDDIWRSDGADYYLQPIVVKPLPDDKWELVDGQQRLTTLYLIFQYMASAGLQSMGPAYSLEYETRATSAEYLQNPDEERSTQNIDFFHIFEAQRCIAAWFDGHGNRRQNAANKLYGYLFDSVRVIWYEAAADVDATELFARLNIGRIPLTDAELVKAQLVSSTSKDGGRTDRTHEVAAQWDAIERELRSPEVWSFATARSRGVPTHISLLLDTLADTKSDAGSGRDRPLFHTFETLRPLIEADPEDMWDQVVDLHSLVLGWYANRDLFHRIGFLTASGASFREMVQLSTGCTKSAFEARLDRRISNDLAMSADDVRDLGYDDRAKALKALLLMNVETVRRAVHSSERFSFSAFASDAWSLEHIHAQNAEPLKRAEQWTEWLRLHRAALAELPGVEAGVRADVLERIDAALPEITQERFRQLERELTELFSLKEDSSASDVDSISNLALLSSGDNSALSNSVFEVKRRAVIARDRQGSYIPASTRNAFLKYYTESSGQQIHFWGDKDRAGYLEELLTTLKPYLSPTKEVTAS